jgi:2-polyprenyl-3-methyl-5-hydroxy-6-metoxy-1,4-benzoquinol methylase
MEVTTLEQAALQRTSRRLRLCVVIASYGDKNIEFLKRIIRNYQGMDMEVAIFVLSEAPKDLGPDVKVLVGLPSRNPWSLPFGHKRVFADNLDRYDLFAYSEDDMEVTEENFHAFLRVTPELEDDEIAGFLRYETSPSGTDSFPEAHGSFHWKVETVRQRGPNVIAEFSNEHAAFYILTQPQLRRAIASGGFLRPPYESRYDMLCSAATDPYTSCGFRKVICISALDDFVIHHLPNRYVGQLGLTIDALAEQIRTLTEILRGSHPGHSLCATEAKILHGRWSKNYYENPCDDLLKLVPDDAKTILSIGCGSGATELELRQRGAEITVLPLDSIMGATVSRLGFEVIYGNLQESLEKLRGRQFGCLLITNLLHLLPDPWGLLDECAGLVESGGALVVSGVNFNYLPILVRRTLGLREYRKLRNFAASGINLLAARVVVERMRQAGLGSVALRWYDPARARKLNWARSRFGRWLMGGWIVRGQKAIPLSKRHVSKRTSDVLGNS